MTLADLFDKAGIAVGIIRAALSSLSTSAPDLADDIAALIAKLDAPLTPEGLVALGGVSLDELRKLGRLELDGRRHPSDAA